MTLAQRLLVAIGVLAIATTATLGLGVREAWRRTEQERFDAQFESAVRRLELELTQEIQNLPELLGPLCAHDPVLDGALVDLRTGRLDAGRRLALSLRVPELMKAMRLDELVLLTGEGEILGAGHRSGLAGTHSAELAALLARPSKAAYLRVEEGPLALVAHCRRSTGGASVGLYGARHFGSLLADVGSSHGLSLTVGEPRPEADVMLQTVQLQQLGGVTLVATRSRMPLHEALQKLDSTVLMLGAGTFAAALLLAMLLSRGLARPIVDLSRQARRVVSEEPEPVRGRGGKELEELAEAFNQAISDLVVLRKRLAATERIAARREIARRVAHEIKNPLAPIRAAVETLRRLRARNDPEFDAYFDEATRTVLAEVARISNIVQEFTRFARLPPPKPAPLDLTETVRNVVALHAAGGIDIRLDSETLPTIIADRDQIVQVLTNLLQNAIDAASHAPAPRIRVLLGAGTGDRVVLRVRDNGPGVDPAMRDRLFEPYATTKPEGTGLGLAIAQRIAVEHGGDITYADAPGGGAELTVTLPVAGPAMPADPPKAPPPGGP